MNSANCKKRLSFLKKIFCKDLWKSETPSNVITVIFSCGLGIVFKSFPAITAGYTISQLFFKILRDQL